MQLENRVLLRLSVVRCIGALVPVVLLCLAGLVWARYSTTADWRRLLLVPVSVVGLTLVALVILRLALTRFVVLRVRNGRIEEVGLFGRLGHTRSVPVVPSEGLVKISLGADDVSSTASDHRVIKIIANGGAGNLITRVGSTVLSKATRSRLKAGEQILIELNE